MVKMKQTSNNLKVFSKKCPYCSKVISSLIESQFKYNYEQHIKSHERKNDKKQL